MQYKEQFNLIDEMVSDAFEVNVAYDELQSFDEEELLNEKVQKLYQLLKEINTLLFGGSSNTRISICVRLFAPKSNLNLPDQCLKLFAKVMLDSSFVK